MKNSSITYLTDASIITCVVRAGLAETILKASRDLGVMTGAISFHARGYGARERLGLLGIAVEAEKDVISMIVSSDQQDRVLDGIYRAGKLDTLGNGYLYITPTEKVATYVPQDMLKALKERS